MYSCPYRWLNSMPTVSGNVVHNTARAANQITITAILSRRCSWYSILFHLIRDRTIYPRFRYNSHHTERDNQQELMEQQSPTHSRNDYTATGASKECRWKEQTSSLKHPLDKADKIALCCRCPIPCPSLEWGSIIR